jgi:hypothetical protein
MAKPSKEEGIILALVERFEKHRYPQALAMKQRVENGETLTDLDIQFLGEVFHDCEQVRSFVDQRPEWQQLAARAFQLYKDITDKALENERRG